MQKHFIKRGKNLLILAILIVILVLECFPSVKMIWAHLGEDGSVVHSETFHNYFDLLLVGYGRYFPLFISICTIVLIIIYLIRTIKLSILNRLTRIILSFILFFGIMHIVFYYRYQTGISISIFVLICLVFAIEFAFTYMERIRKSDN